MPLRHSHRRTEKKIVRLFTNRLDGRSTVRLWNTLRDCPSCAEFYERHHALESALTKKRDGLSIFSIERVGNAITRNQAPPSRRFFRWLTWFPEFAGAMGVILVAVLILRGEHKPHRIDLSQTGGAGWQELATRGTSRTSTSFVGVRLFTVTSAKFELGERPGLYLNDTITFTYTYTKNETGYLMLFGLQKETDFIMWYYPDFGQEESIPISGDRVDEPLGDGIILSTNHKLGPLRIVSLFSSCPITVAVVNDAVEQMRRDDSMMDADAFIPLDNTGASVIEYSILTVIRGTSDSHDSD